MPTDANIPLSVQVPQQQDPIANYARIMQIKSAIGGQQLQQSQLQLQQSQLTGANQENDIRATQIQQMHTLNQAYADALTVGPDGAASIDSGKLTKALATGGAGVKIQPVLQQMNEYQQSVANLAKTRGEVNQQKTDAAGMLGLAARDAGYDPRMYLLGLQHAIDKNAIDANEAAPAIQKIQQAMLQDPTLASAKAITKQFADAALGGSVAAQKFDFEKRQATSSERRAQALENRAATYEESVSSRADAENWKPSGTRNGNQVYFNSKTGQERVGGPVDMQPDNKGRALTPGQSAVQDRADQREEDNGRKMMDAVHVQRTAIGSALAVQNGDTYNDPKTGKPATQPMDDSIRAGLQQQFQNVTNQGLRIQQRFGWNEIQAPGGAAAPAAAPPPAAKAAQPTYKENDIVRNAAGQRLQLRNNVWKPI